MTTLIQALRGAVFDLAIRIDDPKKVRLISPTLPHTDWCWTNLETGDTYGPFANEEAALRDILEWGDVTTCDVLDAAGVNNLDRNGLHDGDFDGNDSRLDCLVGTVEDLDIKLSNAQQIMALQTALIAAAHASLPIADGAGATQDCVATLRALLLTRFRAPDKFETVTIEYPHGNSEACRVIGDITTDPYAPKMIVAQTPLGRFNVAARDADAWKLTHTLDRAR